MSDFVLPTQWSYYTESLSSSLDSLSYGFVPMYINFRLWHTSNIFLSCRTQNLLSYSIFSKLFMIMNM